MKDVDNTASTSYPDGWIESTEMPGYIVKSFQIGNVKWRAFRPILTPEEREKRERRIMEVVGRILSKYDDLEDEDETHTN